MAKANEATWLLNKETKNWAKSTAFKIRAMMRHISVALNARRRGTHQQMTMEGVTQHWGKSVIWAMGVVQVIRVIRVVRLTRAVRGYFCFGIIRATDINVFLGALMLLWFLGEGWD